MTTEVRAKTTDAGKRFISEVDFEANYGISRKTLQKWRLFGKGPRFLKFGTSVRYDIQDIEAWVATCRSKQNVQTTA